MPLRDFFPPHVDIDVARLFNFERVDVRKFDKEDGEYTASEDRLRSVRTKVDGKLDETLRWHLNLAHVHDLEPAHLIQLAQIQGLPPIRKLTLDFTTNPHFGGLAELAGMPALAGLEWLFLLRNLAGVDVYPEAAELIKSLRGTGVRLYALDAGGLNWDAAAWTALAESAELARLECFESRHDRIDAAAAAAFFDRPAPMRLKHLTFVDDELPDALIASLCASPRTANLSELLMWSCNLSDSAVQCLLDAPFLPQLKTWVFTQSQMTDRTATQLLDAPLDNLQSIGLFPARQLSEPVRQQLYKRFQGRFEGQVTHCGCRTYTISGRKEFIPSQKPDEWRLVHKETIPSQMHCESGSHTYLCEICGSSIHVEWREHEEYNEQTHGLISTYDYWVEEITPPPVPKAPRAR